MNLEGTPTPKAQLDTLLVIERVAATGLYAVTERPIETAAPAYCLRLSTHRRKEGAVAWAEGRASVTGQSIRIS